jgi:hypothetical protein
MRIVGEPLQPADVKTALKLLAWRLADVDMIWALAAAVDRGTAAAASKRTDMVRNLAEGDG